MPPRKRQQRDKRGNAKEKIARRNEAHPEDDPIRSTWCSIGQSEEPTRRQWCWKFAELVSKEHIEGIKWEGFGWMEGDEHSAEVWKFICRDVFDTRFALNDTDHGRLALSSHFLTILFGISQQASPISLILRSVIEGYTVSCGLLSWLPDRSRELYERRNNVQLTPRDEHPPFIAVIVQKILEIMEGEQFQDSFTNHDDNTAEWKFIHRGLESLLDLLLHHEMRETLIPYLISVHFVIRGRLALGSPTFSRAPADTLLLAQQLFERIHSSMFHSSDYVNTRTLYHQRAGIVQKMCQRYFEDELPDVIFSGAGILCQEGLIRTYLNGFSDENLLELLHKLRLVDKASSDVGLQYKREFLLQILEEHLVIPKDSLEELQQYPIYPNETVLWDFTRIPPSHPSLLPPSHVLSLPKLHLSYLSFADYLRRNFDLMRLSTAYDIRSDLVDVIRRLRPVVRQSLELDAKSNEVHVLRTEFSGWARMALEIHSPLALKKVSKPAYGIGAAQVVAEFAVDLSPCGVSIRREWDSLGEFDNVFLVQIDASRMSGRPAPSVNDRLVPDEDDRTFPERYGVIRVRGAMIMHVRDENGTLLSDALSEKQQELGLKRIFTVSLDPTQYFLDEKSFTGTDLYQSLNVVVRRHGRENNFKAVLETIRGLMSGTGSINRVLPSYLQNVMLGRDTFSFTAQTGVSKVSFFDFGDTFIDEKHLRDSFPGAKIKINLCDDLDESRRRNYRLRFDETIKGLSIEALVYLGGSICSGNSVRFTPSQVSAIRRGLSTGLSLTVGPPGTGKTDVAVQIIASLYHSFPNQRIVVITHSNAALNDIFEKLALRGDVEEHGLLRLGAGEKELRVVSSHDFTKSGRVAYCLAQRSLLLEEVQKLSETLGVSGKAERGPDGSPGYTCETAEYFWKLSVKRLIRRFELWAEDNIAEDSDSIDIDRFPFKAFFNLESKISLDEARKLIDKVKGLFESTSLYRPFELLTSQRQRADYMLIKQARVVAMTCTHAAIARSHLIELGFEYDSLVIEEAGQMVEIESFIPLLLQRGDPDGSDSTSSRLKRVCLLGDHNQLPPVIKNMSFANFSNLDQSMFARLIRLGVPYTQLDRQGRARPEIAQLYSWRYNNLENLDHVTTQEHFQVANAGFAHTLQLINVDEFQGKGETSPTAYFYQNVGEAEYAVALFQYMVLIGHSTSKISILTTYNGQKQLIEDIVSQRCGDGTPLEGVRPGAISTVDQYQGQQNDIILLSLVRTESVGHLRDVRRLVVALSRARLGLYVFCRQNLFSSVPELRQAFDQFETKPNKLTLVLNETYPTDRKVNDAPESSNLLEVDDVSHLGAIVHKMQEDLIAQLE
ncbi:intron-binding protein aquarius [Fistulifera solaris]|uniref:Intron-binding protein aquarius n=1 Tax=Fistulifera solaris TaxID=1519565 RepID=A0A1Z5KGT5_FISSO|nr:intron-binding protein aquarius [Fistulifera solaris]|eukprot:GAX25325.1 intron-binding protein aquarius [Fistulifera solaris]